MWQRNEHGGSRAVSRHGTHRGVKILVRADLAAPCSTGRRLLLERAIELACLHGASGMAPPRKPSRMPLREVFTHRNQCSQKSTCQQILYYQRITE